MKTVNISQLKSFELLKDLDEARLLELSQSLRPVLYHSGDLIFQEGGPAASLYLILQGQVVYGKYSGRRKRRRLLKILGPGDTFGEEALFAPEVCPCPGFARALSDAEVLFWERASFWKTVESHPFLLKYFIAWLTRQVKVFECKLVELAYESLEQNLLRLLFVLMQRFGVATEKGVRLEIDLSRQDLADLLGAHLDTVIHELSRLRDRGLLVYERHKIVIKDPQTLEEQAQPATTCLSEKLF
jgi:CRP-like cAMP-binding protein